MLKVGDRKYIKFFIVGVFVTLSFLCCENANASCLSESGGRGGIDSVQWACKQYNPWNSNAACSLWIGGSKSQNTVIEVSQLSGTVTAYMYGMCTKGSYSARNVYVKEDNGAFKDNNLGYVERGKWGSPKKTPIKVNVAKFIEGVSPVHTSAGDEYTRNVLIHRCFVRSSSCSSQHSKVTIRVVNVKIGTVVVEGVSELTSVDGAIKGEDGIYQAIDDNATAYFRHGLYQKNGYGIALSELYGLNDELNRVASLSDGKTFWDARSLNRESSGSIGLNMDDTSISLCQKISFKSKTWEIYLKGNVEAYNDIGYSTPACAQVHRPWNFNISNISNITANEKQDEDEKNIVYAGETKPLDYKIDIKKNIENYPITDIPNATITLSDGYQTKTICNSAKISKNGISCNDSSNSYGYYMNDPGYTVNYSYGDWVVPDLPAGTVYKLTLRISPQNSGTGYVKDFNGEIKIDSDYIVAKRPSIQVWGGNVYSKGNISTNTAFKYDVLGYNGTYPRIFGSWAELGVISNGTVTGFASGAATGYDSNNDGTLIANPGGGTSTNFCDRSILTIPNNKCNNNKTAGGMTLSAMYNRVSNDKESIINKMINNESSEKIKTSEIDGINELASSEIEVYYNDGDIYIKDDIKFSNNDDKKYTKLYEIPKIVIYAKNVYVNCNVTRIDALIMADDTVYTCTGATSENVNDEQRSKQLRINGAVIASKLMADRTYGAATGNNSITPAEIINFDPSLYLWGGDIDKMEDTYIALPSELDTTYIHELAPRR